MKIRYSNTIDDVVAFARYHAARSQSMQLLMAVVRWVLPAMMAILAGLSLLQGAWASVAWCLVPAILLFIVAPWIPGLAARLSYREGKNKGVFGPHELELVPPNLIERSLVSEQRTWLGAVEHVGTTATHAFLFVSANSAHVIPKASVTDGDYEGFVQAVKEEVEKAKRDGQRSI
jgi:hypothetical protein